MQSKTFSQLSILVAVVLTGFVLVRIAGQAASTVPLPEFPEMATSTSEFATSTPVVATTTQVSGAASLASVVNLAVPQKKVPTIPVKVPRGTIHAIVASTSIDREVGLGGRKSLPADTGMLFVFEQPGEYGFWMKDTLIPLDFIWVTSDKKVANIDKNVIPETYPKVFYPPTDILYVLELSSGGAAKWGIASGTQLVF